MKLYKLTDEDCCTYNGTRWGVNVTHEGTGEGALCGPGWIHAYTDPLLAVLLNPIHGDFKSPRLWEAEGEVGKSDHGLKVGCKKLTTTSEISLPVITTEQTVRFAILCALEVYQKPSFITWANGWLENKDRSRAAEVAWAAEAAWAAAWADESAWAAWAAESAWSAARAAESAAWAAESAEAAESAARAKVINLSKIASEAMKRV